MWIRNLIAAAASLVVAFGASPNIVFFFTDDEDTSLINLAGGMAVLPTVRDQIFAAGINLTAGSFVSSPICCPSRGSLFSGRYSHNLGDPSIGWCGNFTQVREDTMLTALSHAGYRVGQFGKWYNEEPTFKPPYVPAWHNASKFNRFFVQLQEAFFNVTYNSDGAAERHGDAPDDYDTAVVGNATLRWLRQVAADTATAPFVAFVSMHAPHIPATPAPWYASAPIPTELAPRTPNWNLGWGGKHWQIDNGIDKPMSTALINGSDALWRARLRRWGAKGGMLEFTCAVGPSVGQLAPSTCMLVSLTRFCSLMSVDDVVHDTLALLEEQGVLDNTYVIYSSDHGYHLGQWGLWSEKVGELSKLGSAPRPRDDAPPPPPSQANPLEPDVRVPLAIRGPGIPAGAATLASVLTTNLDLAPTMLEWAGAPNAWPSGTGVRDGRSLSAVLAAATSSGLAPVPPPPGWRDRLLLEFVGWQVREAKRVV
jgi:N-acetylglucosamine-6-sulfatase